MDRELVLLAGDWHGNVNWAQRIISQLPYLLPDEAKPLILHLGDFGIWHGKQGLEYRMRVSVALEAMDAELWFVDGNHENHELLADYAKNSTTEDGRVFISPRIYHLPRNYRFELSGRTFHALGGAVSVDKVLRREGVDWWPDEALTAEEAATACEGISPDVVLAHDAPQCVPFAFGPPPKAWATEDLHKAQLHRELLQKVTDCMSPALWVHGHYHVRQNWTSPEGTRYVGLDKDDTRGNVAVLDLVTGVVG